MTTSVFEESVLDVGHPGPAGGLPQDASGWARALLDPQGVLFVVLLALAASVALVVLASAAVRLVGA